MLALKIGARLLGRRGLLDKSDNFARSEGPRAGANKVVQVDDAKVKLQIWDTAGQERFRSVTHAYYRDAHALLLLYDVSNKTSFDNIRAWLGEIKEYAQNDVVIMLLASWDEAQRAASASVRRVAENAFNTLTCSTDYHRAGIVVSRAWIVESRWNVIDKDLLALLKQGFIDHGNKADCAASERLVRKEDGERLAREYHVPFMETSAKTGLNVELAFMAIARDLLARKTGDKDGAAFNVQDYVREKTQKVTCPQCNT
ncbi:unnamed protein product [Bemisia tabaci]|uniref:Ras-related protein Rab-26 n=1 Tax=Bemisia tabaci TaxID=7038 RepID=A0A9P0F904_BEMTA|nr:unnamed protein product [Bemisia tabaci]